MALEILGERWLLMGKPKVGKSTMAASFPDPLVINLDGAGNKYVFPSEMRIDCYDYADCKKAVTQVAKRQGWRTLIFDPIDKLVTFIDLNISKDKRYSCIADIPHGGGWSRQVALFNQFLEEFWSAAERNPNLAASIIVAHSKQSDDGQSLTIRKALHSYLQGGVNNIVYCMKKMVSDQLSFTANLSGSEVCEAGCRNPTLQQAGTIQSNWKDVVSLFDPPFDKMQKALAWAETKGGIPRAEFQRYAHARGKTTNFEMFELLKSMRDQPAMLQSVKAEIERMVI
jgi:hypothetical protein